MTAWPTGSSPAPRRGSRSEAQERLDAGSCEILRHLVADESSSVLIVADPKRVGELAAALADPLPPPYGEIDVSASTGTDDTIDLFGTRRPPVVILTASLELGDAKSLIETLREMAPRGEVAIVLVGDDAGPIRNAIDALDLAPDRFVSRPLSEKALRFAVQSGLDMVALRREPVPARTTTDKGTGVAASGAPAEVGDDPTDARQAQRARWAALADAIGDGGSDVDDGIVEETELEPEPLPPPILIQPRGEYERITPVPWAQPREPTLIIRGPAPPEVIATEPGNGIADEAQWPRKITEERWPHLGERSSAPRIAVSGDDNRGNGDDGVVEDKPVRSRTTSDPPQSVGIAQRGHDEEEEWSQPIPLRELVERSDSADADANGSAEPPPSIASENTPPPLVRGEQVEVMAASLAEPDVAPPAVRRIDEDRHIDVDRPAGRDFARRLREKMSQMAQRLFQDGAPSPAPVDVGPRHDHHAEIDLAAFGEEPSFGGIGVTELEARRFADVRELTTSPSSWDTQVRERGLPDSGEVVRGVSDAAMLLAKLFAQSGTGRIAFRRDDVEKVVYFDAGRPVFASSDEPGDRMGELLVREGKITAAQYERCQTHVAQSGRRMGEILVDFGYLKRRELLPAVRRHVEDIVYSLFGWDRGHYHITPDQTASGERIRLSRHPASLILEGVRRKLDRSTLERLVGPPSTVVEVRDRERLGGVVNSSDLGAEERAALAAFDGQADLAAVARASAGDVADILPLAWGLCVLGLATLRRADAELEEATALVGETDLAIDRERVRARWQLVTEADYFALLGVRRDATAFEIRRAYQAARRDFAADGFPADLRRELARELDDIAIVIDEAFRVLRDDRLRGTYLSNLVD